MAGYDWKWDRLPEYEYEAARQAIDSYDLNALFLLNSKYLISPETYCCPEHGIYLFFKQYFSGL